MIKTKKKQKIIYSPSGDYLFTKNINKYKLDEYNFFASYEDLVEERNHHGCKPWHFEIDDEIKNMGGIPWKDFDIFIRKN